MKLKECGGLQKSKYSRTPSTALFGTGKNGGNCKTAVKGMTFHRENTYFGLERRPGYINGRQYCGGLCRRLQLRYSRPLQLNTAEDSHLSLKSPEVSYALHPNLVLGSCKVVTVSISKVVNVSISKEQGDIS